MTFVILEITNSVNDRSDDTFLFPRKCHNLLIKTIYCGYVGLFTWREGASANRATRLEELKHSPPLHATYLTGTASGLRGQFFERPLSKTNKMANQKNFLAASLIFFRSFH